MSNRRKKEEQSGGDREVYDTPPWCVDRLLDDSPIGSMLAKGTRWFEPAASEGNICRAVSARLPGIDWTANEIRSECAPSLTVCARDVRSCDFLKLEPVQLMRANDLQAYPFDVLITNPPYSLAFEFVEHAHRFARFVVFLLPLNFWASEKRHAVHAVRMPHWTGVLPNRPKFVDGSSDSREYGWMVWDTSKPTRSSSVHLLGLTPKAVRSEQEGANVREARKRIDAALRAKKAGDDLEQAAIDSDLRITRLEHKVDELAAQGT